MKYEVIVVGAGLAGLTAALSLQKQGVQVLVLEKNSFPNHKVCGEYISNEVRPLLEGLGLNLTQLGAVSITQFAITNTKGRRLSCQLPLGGFGISRFTLDHALYQLALECGVTFSFQGVTNITFQEDSFLVTTKKERFTSRLVLGAFGKRSTLDKALNRPFIQQKSPWVGIKAHYTIAHFPKDEVSLHTFPGGYAGLSMVEEGKVNLCYLAHYKQFQQFGDIQAFNMAVLRKNPALKKFLDQSEPLMDRPLSIAQISFAKKEIIMDHMLMCGDSSGLIHPLCGNGMAMAIHAAKIASEVVVPFLNDRSYSRAKLEKEYRKRWQHHFNSRLVAGRMIQHAITKPTMINGLFSIIPNSQRILERIIQQTHGKPILV